jgi:hypothetical protein
MKECAMSSARPLPAHPSLRQLKIQAKELLHAHQSGSAKAFARLRETSAELSDVTDDVIQAAKFSLLDAQRVIAREYGFDSWHDLGQHVEATRMGTFDDLFQLDHGQSYLISHELDLHDLAVVLHVMTAEQSRLFTFNMPDDMRAVIDADSAARRATPEQVDQAKQHIMQQVQRLADEGQLVWPPGTPRKPHKPGATNRASEILTARLQQTIRPELSERSFEEIDELMADLSQLARLMGILELDQFVEGVGDRFLKQGLQMAMDGAEPDRVTETLENWMHSLLHEQEVRFRKVIAGMRSVQKGDNPKYVRGTLGLIH